MANSIVITAQTATPRSILYAADATFFVTASSNFDSNNLVNRTHQWSVGGTPIAGANLATYTVPNVQAANAGTYSVNVSALSATSTGLLAVATVASNNMVITIAPLSSEGEPWVRWAKYPETGHERQRRLHNLGYV